jgi:zinc transport system substrate-binding protein
MIRRFRGQGALALAVVVAIAAGSCSSDDAEGGEDGRIRVVASFYPLAEAARAVGGDLVNVENLTPPGVEPHDLELAPDDLEALVTADLVIYLGGGFQPAVEDGIGQAEGTTLDLLDAAGPLEPPDPGDEEAEELAADPHVWLDPARYAMIVDAIAEALAGLRPSDAGAFRSSGAAFVDDLEALDREFADGLGSCDQHLIVVNHAAFGYLAAAYGLEQVAISGLSPEAEPTPDRLAELRTLVQEEGVTTIFTEELASPEVAEALARETGVTTAVLNPLEGLTPQEVDAGEDYLSVMRSNLELLRTALGCD